MFSSDADLFFTSPRATVDPPNWFGTLYLLRRDIDLCMGVDPTTGQSASLRAEWPGAMAMLGGIDLLAKFFKGVDGGGVGVRFREFIGRFFAGVSSTDSEVIYQLRNSLLHSFGLYSSVLKKGAQVRVYRFVLTSHGAGALVSHKPPNQYYVDLRVLHREFENGVAAYCAALDSDPKLQGNFAAMFNNYGRVRID
jgi:hypothetical protein